MQDIDHGEMLAIAEALDAAIRLARSGEFKGAARIFSDSKECLRLLACGNIGRILQKHPYIDDNMAETICAVIWMSHHLRSLLSPESAPLELNWMPGHNHEIYPHVISDHVSRDIRSGTTKAARLNPGPSPELRWEWDGIRFEDSMTSDIDIRCWATKPYRR